MSDPSCIFCRLIAGELPCVKVWEDDHLVAILDAFPATPGMTLLLAKEHHSSDFLAIPTDLYQHVLFQARELSAAMKRALRVERVALVMEGMGVDHFHLKLYPLHGVDQEWKAYLPPVRAYWDRYPGYLTTQMGPPAALPQLESIGQEIRNAFLA